MILIIIIKDRTSLTVNVRLRRCTLRILLSHAVNFPYHMPLTSVPFAVLLRTTAEGGPRRGEWNGRTTGTVGVNDEGSGRKA